MPKLTSGQWLVVAIIQIAYGLLIFGITRAYYGVDGVEPTQAAWPSTSLNQSASTPVEDIATLGQEADQAFQTQDLPRAAELYTRLIELTPGDVDLYNNLGLTLHYLGDTPRAVEILRRGVNIDPEYQRIWLTLGFVLSSAGDRQGAKEALERAIAIAPQNEIATEAKSMLERLTPNP